MVGPKRPSSLLASAPSRQRTHSPGAHAHAPDAPAPAVRIPAHSFRSSFHEQSAGATNSRRADFMPERSAAGSRGSSSAGAAMAQCVQLRAALPAGEHSRRLGRTPSTPPLLRMSSASSAHCRLSFRHSAVPVAWESPQLGRACSVRSTVACAMPQARTTPRQAPQWVGLSGCTTSPGSLHIGEKSYKHTKP